MNLNVVQEEISNEECDERLDYDKHGVRQNTSSSVSSNSSQPSRAISFHVRQKSAQLDSVDGPICLGAPYPESFTTPNRQINNVPQTSWFSWQSVQTSMSSGAQSSMESLSSPSSIDETSPRRQLKGGTVRINDEKRLILNNNDKKAIFPLPCCAFHTCLGQSKCLIIVFLVLLFMIFALIAAIIALAIRKHN
ncbi:unnamed protein product [Protopolystoma xenopodis]|uniref:Uncharacterized protein n=1 Tax=Protopolystoma xenopodis TaxID=117903 RepID=A0A448X2M5_9PLAT|nr:unnamed protein product [Protopolystoma xenopodis]